MRSTDIESMMEQYGTEYRAFPPYNTRYEPKSFYVASDTMYVMIDAEDLTEAVQDFTAIAEGMPALYLIQNGEVLAAYNGGQSEPEGEIIYHVTHSELAEWLKALATVKVP